MPDPQTIEQLGTTVERWDKELGAYMKQAESWKKETEDIYNTFMLTDKQGNISKESEPARFNPLWSNTETTGPSIFAKEPAIVVERRHKDPDEIGRLAGMVIERATSADLESDDLEDTFTRTLLDYMLAGRGAPWVRYDPDIRTTEVPLTVQTKGNGKTKTTHYMDGDGKEVMDDDAMEKEDGNFVRVDEDVVSERAPLDYIHRNDFAHKPANTWAELKRSGWVAKRVMMTKKEVVKRFGKEFSNIPVDHMPEGWTEDADDNESTRLVAMAEVWEIWDAQDHMVHWICRGYKEKALKSMQDPLGLRDFFPCPKPAYGTLNNKTLIPAPDYRQYRALAQEVDRLTERIKDISNQIKLRGFYDSSMESIGTALEPGGPDDMMIPVSNMSQYTDAGSVGNKVMNVVQWLPIEQLIEVLRGLYESREQAKNDLYEISGISDLLRGQVDPREKLGQSRIKGQFATIRIDARRRTFDKMIRDTLRIKAEIIAEHFDPMTLKEMSGWEFLPEVIRIKEQEAEGAQMMQEYQQQAQQAQMQGQQPPPPPEVVQPGTSDQLWQQVVDLLQTDKMRGFRIDIETDSTVELDATDMQQQRVEFLESAGSFMERSIPVIQADPAMAPLLGEMLLFTVRGFKAGRSLESNFEEFVDKLKQAADNPQPDEQQPPPDPEAEAKAEMLQTKTAQLQQDGQFKQQMQQVEAQTKMQHQQGEMQQQQGELQLQQIIASIKEQEGMTDLEIQQLDKAITEQRLKNEKQRGTMQ